MKSSFSFVNLVVGGLLIAGSAVFAHPQSSNLKASNPATVYINNGADQQKFMLDVSLDGRLASTKIPPTDINIAQIDSSVPVKCFFSRPLENEEESVEYAVISQVIASGGVYLPIYHSADRLFCYDSTNEEDRDDTFKVFVTTKSGGYGLVTLTLSEPTFAKVNMIPEYESLSKDVRGISIVHHPDRKDPMWDKHTQIMCGVVSRGNNRTFGLRIGWKFSPAREIDRIACSTDNFRGRVTSISNTSAGP